MKQFVLHPPAFILISWSGRRDLNSRPSPWQGDALPLSYSRLSSVDSNDSTGVVKRARSEVRGRYCRGGTPWPPIFRQKAFSNEGRPRSAASTVAARNAQFSYEATNGATFVGIAQEYCTVVLTLSLTPVPTRNRRVYVRQSKRQADARQPSDKK
jgi:hypothetical protein